MIQSRYHSTLVAVACAVTTACSDGDGGARSAPDLGAGGRENGRGGGGGAGGGSDGGVGGVGGAGQVGGPRVVASDPAEGGETYALEKYQDDAGVPNVYRKLIRVAFDQAMDPSTVHVPIVEVPTGAVRDAEVSWSPDALTATFSIPRLDPAQPASKPLQYDTEYRVDLRSLTSAGGASLDATAPPLGDGWLDFRTLPKDDLLEHTCGHTFDPVFASVVATDAPLDSSIVGQPHRRYEIILAPSGGGASEGYLYLRVPAEGALDSWAYTAYMSASVPLSFVAEADGLATEVESVPTPGVCALITAGSRTLLSEGQAYFIHVGPTDAGSFELFFERERR